MTSEVEPTPAAPVEPPPQAPPRRPSRKRRLVVWGLIAVAALLTLVGSLNVWVKRQLLDTDNWVQASSKLLENEDVRDALALRLVDTLFANVDVQASLEQRLPSTLDPVAGPIAGALQGVAVQGAEQLLEGPRVQALWEDINRRMHERLVAVLEGNEGGRITTAGGDVVLDLSPLVQQLADRFQIVAELPPGAGQITIMESDRLEAAQKAVRAIKVMSVFIVLVVLALLALAVYLARGFRREALRGIGASILVVGVILLVVRRVLGQAIVDALTSDATKDAGDAAWLIATDLLRDLAMVMVALGVLALVGAWLAGPTRPAVWIRRRLSPTMRERPVLVYGVVFLAFLLVLAWGPTGSSRRLIGIIILGLLLALGVEALRRQTVKEFPAEGDEGVAALPPPPDRRPA